MRTLAVQHRLKLVIVKEKEYLQIREEKSKKEVFGPKEELRRLKAFALLVL